MTRAIARFLFNAVGMLSLALGVLGIFLPLLPTTPLLLLAAFCFARGSDRMYQWLLNHPLFGRTIRNFREHQAVTVQTKIIAIALLWLAIGNVVFFLVDSELLRVLLLLIASGVTVYLLSLRTLTKEMKHGEATSPRRRTRAKTRR